MASLLIDLSAWARSSHPSARARWKDLVEGDELACHPVFALELLHNSINPEDHQRLRNDLDAAFAWVWPDDDTARLALRLQQRMATARACGQRVKTADILISALAVQHRLGVLHYDADYDLIRRYGGEGFESRWLAGRGTLEGPSEARLGRERTLPILSRTMARHRHQYLAEGGVAPARSQTERRSSRPAPPVDEQEAEKQGSQVLAYVAERRALEGIAPNPELRSRIRAAADEWPDE